MFNMASSRLTDELFERALSDSLKDFPHIPCLKEEQKRCLRSVADKKDVFGILPTGFGRSLIFQLLPRLSRELWKLERTTVLVVTPLVAIMKDQVEEMNRLGLKAFGIGDERSERDLLSSTSDHRSPRLTVFRRYCSCHAIVEELPVAVAHYDLDF